MKIMSYKKEETLQMKIIAEFRKKYPELTQCLFHVNNNSNSSSEGAKNKKLGVTPGISDLIFLGTKGRVFFIELKTEKGIQSFEQKRFEAQCDYLGHRYVIIRSVDSFFEFITPYLPVRSKFILFLKKILKIV